MMRLNLTGLINTPLTSNTRVFGIIVSALIFMMVLVFCPSRKARTLINTHTHTHTHARARQLPACWLSPTHHGDWLPQSQSSICKSQRHFVSAAAAILKEVSLLRNFSPVTVFAYGPMPLSVCGSHVAFNLVEKPLSCTTTTKTLYQDYISI